MDRAASINQIRQRLRQGGTTIGTWMQIPSTSVAEILGRAGYDWVAVDMEHGAIGAHHLPDLFRAVELGSTLPLARLLEGTASNCKQALDAGAAGIIAPMIESAEQLIRVRDASRWPPAGKRGVGYSRANLFGKYFEQYAIEAQSPMLIAMIEHHRAVAQLPEILSVEGLDAILIGPYDLSASLGVTGQFSAPEFRSTMSQIRDAAGRAHIAAGIHVVNPSPEELRARHTEGYRFLAYSIDSVFLNRAATRPQP